MMSKLYVGNLPNDVTEDSIRDLFMGHQMNPSTVLVKRGGYAFVDVELNEIDNAIGALNGFQFMGNNIKVEPSVGGGAANKNMLETRVRVSGVPVNYHPDELDQLLASAGEVSSSERYETKDGVTQVVQVMYATGEGASEAVERLNGHNLEGGHNLRVERLADRKPRNNQRNPQTGGRGMMGGHGGPMSNRHLIEFPLSILVQSEMVGAIIGRQGATIRTITQQSRARVDVHRRDNAGAAEKKITIFGNPENCTSACKRILEVQQGEIENTNRGGEICLKILADNNLIGRIIGKQGATIKKIMEDSNTRITVSSVNDIHANGDRTITVKGTIDDMANAQSAISAKLRSSFESDVQNMGPQSAAMFPGLHPMAMMSTGGMMGRDGGMGSRGGNYMGHPSSPQWGPAGPAFPPPYSFNGGAHHYGDYHSGLQEIAYLYIPHYSVGAIIGSRGSQIRKIISFSGASVKIANQESEESALNYGSETEPVPVRKVTIVGSPEAQWKAQFLIFEKIKEEFRPPNLCEEVRLTVELLVPSSQVGRLIGRNGQNVRDLQRQTGAVVKLPSQSSPSTSQEEEEETVVHITGMFLAVQSAQRRIRAMMASYQASSQQPPMPYTSGRRSGSPRTTNMQ